MLGPSGTDVAARGGPPDIAAHHGQNHDDDILEMAQGLSSSIVGHDCPVGGIMARVRPRGSFPGERHTRY